MIRAGQLNQRITFYQKTKTSGSKGVKHTYTKVDSSRAKVTKNITDNADEKSDNLKSTLNIEMRYYAKYNENMQIEFKGQRYRITAFDNVDFKNRQLLIQAELTQ